MTDFQQAAQFLTALGPPPYVFQTFDDNKDRKAKNLVRVLVGTLEQHWQALTVLNGGGAGVFVQVNTGSARKIENITDTRAVFLDFDNPAALRQNVSKLFNDLPAPGIVVHSSPGKAHTYWPLSPSGVTAEHFKWFQVAAAKAYGADEKVHNWDRVMRLPGTLHCKGAPFPVTCTVTPTRTTFAELYNRLQNVNTTAKVDVNSASVLVSNESFELPESLPPGNRTQALVQYAGQLVGKGYGADYVKESIRVANDRLCPEGTEPIPPSILEAEVLQCVAKFISRRDGESTQPQSMPNGVGTEVQAQVQQPVKYANNLEQWEERFVYIEAGQRVADLLMHPTMAVYRLEEFAKSNANRFIGKSPAVNKWLVSAARKIVRDTRYLPGADRVFQSNDGLWYYNTYVESDLINVQTFEPDQFRIFANHLHLLLGNAENVERFLYWMAFSIQKPSVRVPWLPLLVSAPGLGKGFLFQTLQLLMGRKNCKAIGPDDLSDKKAQFNEWMAESTLVCIDELYTQRRWDMMERLKPLITEHEILVNHKFGAKAQVQVFCNFLAFSNHPDAAALQPNDRRFWVIHSNALPPSPAYYEALFGWLITDGPAHLKSFLQSLDISGWAHAAPPPMTEAKQRMIEASTSLIEQCIQDAVENRDGVFAASVVDAEMVESHVQVVLGLPDKINHKDKHQIRHVLASLTPPLPQPQYRVKVAGGKTHRRRLQCVRDHAHWSTTTPDGVGAEFERAFLISVGQYKGPALSSVPVVTP